MHDNYFKTKISKIFNMICHSSTALPLLKMRKSRKRSITRLSHTSNPSNFGFRVYITTFIYVGIPSLAAALLPIENTCN